MRTPRPRALKILIPEAPSAIARSIDAWIASLDEMRRGFESFGADKYRELSFYRRRLEGDPAGGTRLGDVWSVIVRRPDGSFGVDVLDLTPGALRLVQSVPTSGPAGTVHTRIDGGVIVAVPDCVAEFPGAGHSDGEDGHLVTLDVGFDLVLDKVDAMRRYSVDHGPDH